MEASRRGVEEKPQRWLKPRLLRTSPAGLHVWASWGAFLRISLFLRSVLLPERCGLSPLSSPAHTRSGPG